MSIVIASATASASIGNVGVGFDILGHAFGAASDTVTVIRDSRFGVHLGEVSGLVSSLPAEVEKNTALAAVAALLEAAGPITGVRVSIEKGVPKSAGMGGSAASAEAAAAATNALLGEPFTREQLLLFALTGERASSDPPPWDNVVASLFGGLVFVARQDPPLIQRLAVPDDLLAVLVHPRVEIETRAARAILSSDVPLKVAVEHSRRAACFFTGCATDDLDLIRAGLEDVLIEPQRMHQFPALPEVRAAAMSAGALGCSFSGSGPSIFAWVPRSQARDVKGAMLSALQKKGIVSAGYIAPIASPGVHVKTSVENRLT